VLPSRAYPHPTFAKYAAPLEHPADVMVHVDSDVVVLRSLEPVLREAERGRIVAFMDRWPQRFFPQWAQALGVERLERRHPYVNAGFLGLPAELGIPLMALTTGAATWWEEQGEPWTDDEWQAYPYFFRDQEFFNAALQATVGEEDLTVLERALAPADGGFDSVRVVDRERLECRDSAGRWPYLLHHWGDEKPWLGGSQWNVYAQLLGRLLFADDVPLRLEPAEVAVRTRPTLSQWLARRRRRRDPREPMGHAWPPPAG
jgi:hypothetical protein